MYHVSQYANKREKTQIFAEYMMKQCEQIKWKIDSYWIHDFKFTLPLTLSRFARNVLVIKFVVVIYDTRSSMQSVQCTHVYAIDTNTEIEHEQHSLLQPLNCGKKQMSNL